MAGPSEIVNGFAEGAAEVASNPVAAVAGVFDVGEANGNDHGSSHWPAWGHAEIRAMLDSTVDQHNIDEVARLWREKWPALQHIVTGCVTALHGIVAGGWRGESAEAAIRSLEPINDWAVRLAEAAGRTTELMDDSGYYAGQAKAAVPPPQPHSWARSLGSFMIGGGPGAFVDAVAQDRAQEAARAEAVRIMTNVYSAPINDNRAAVPVYPQLADPTLRPPEPSPVTVPAPGAGAAGPGLSGGGVAGVASAPPVAAHLQGMPGRSGPPDAVGPAPGPPGGPGQAGVPGVSGGGAPGLPGGGGSGVGAAAAAAAPLLAPLGDAGARRGARGAGAGGGRTGGLGGPGGRAAGGSGGGAGFGPRGSGGGPPGVADGRVGAAPGGAAAAGRGGIGAAPVIGAGPGRGPGGEDTEHRRPPYLIEMNDLFGDGRRVAPPVIGEDPPEHYR